MLKRTGPKNAGPKKPGRVANGETVLVLPSVLDLNAAEPLFRLLKDHLPATRGLVLDGGAVERIATPCLQVLLAAVLDVRASSLPVRLEPQSVVLAEAIADLGLASLLSLQEPACQSMS